MRDRTPVNWGKPAAIGLLLIMVLGLISIPFIPFDGYIPQFEKLAGDYLQQPVKIKSLHLLLLPQPHWRLDDVSVGNQGQLTVARVNAVAELGSMFSDKKVFKSIELESPVLSEEGLLALLFGKPAGQDFKVARIIATNGKLDSKTFILPALDATIALGAKDGAWQTIALETPDHNTKLLLTPDGEGAHVEVQTNAFSMPLNPSFILENFDAKGVMRRGELRLSEFNGGIYGGYLSGSANLKWGADWSLNGEIKARAIDPGKLAQKLIEGGSVEGKAAYAMQAKSYAALFAAPHLEGSFAVARGHAARGGAGTFVAGRRGRRQDRVCRTHRQLRARGRQNPVAPDPSGRRPDVGKRQRRRRCRQPHQRPFPSRNQVFRRAGARQPGSVRHARGTALQPLIDPLAGF